MAHGADGWCVAMDRAQMRCGIYENRPAACRRFAMGGPYCNAVRADYEKRRGKVEVAEIAADGNPVFDETKATLE